jgi:hypothetical protein
MLAEVARPRPGGRGRATAAPEGAFAARARLRSLRDALDASRTARARSRWNEPAVFFFHPERQRELEAARPKSERSDDLGRKVAEETARLSQSVELRHVARAVPGLIEACRTTSHGKPLAELLAVPDDETVLVLQPALQIGIRFAVRGIATVNQFHVLIMDAFDSRRAPSRFRIACENAMPVPAGVPMAVELPHQCFRPAALQLDGTVPESFAGCDQWLWGWEPLAAAPRIDGERVVLLGEPAHPRTWEVELRFPTMAAQAELQQVLNPYQTAERLSRLAGIEIPVHRSPEPRTAALAAA